MSGSLRTTISCQRRAESSTGMVLTTESLECSVPTNMLYPKISIITPSYNQGEFLEQTLQSVICQSYPNLEYIVVDGGSSDNSLAIIKKYEPWLHRWCSEPDGGHASALKKGFKWSSCEIMCWINSDDMLAPWSLKAVADIFMRFPHVNWIQGYASAWCSSGFMTSSYPNNRCIYDFLVSSNSFIQQESTFWRRSL